jgi:dTDP-L-rhamnose 4-epimerase
MPRKLVLSSLRAVYGEGRQCCPACGLEFYPAARSAERLVQARWEHTCPRCDTDAAPLPSLETAPLQPTSVYALTKLAQKHLFTTVAAAYGIPTAVLRYFNVYGPGQSLRNPDTGILSIFARRLTAGQRVDIYEDGRELRDFVHVDDIVEATLLAGQLPAVGVFNICSGQAVTLYQVAAILADILGLPESVLTISGSYRAGDIRHGIGAWELAAEALGYRPQVSLRAGLESLVRWMVTAHGPGAGGGISSDADPDRVAREELQARGLLRKVT